MFWIFLLAIGGAIAFITIDAQSVWLKIFGLGRRCPASEKRRALGSIRSDRIWPMLLKK